MTACSTVATGHQINAEAYLTTEVSDPAKPDLPAPSTIPLASSAAEERRVIWDIYVKPLLKFSTRQAETTAAERRRAQGLVDLIGAANQAAKPPILIDRIRGKR